MRHWEMNCTDCISHPRSANDLQQVEIVGGFEHLTLTIVRRFFIKFVHQVLTKRLIWQERLDKVFKSAIHFAVVAPGWHVVLTYVAVDHTEVKFPSCSPYYGHSPHLWTRVFALLLSNRSCEYTFVNTSFFRLPDGLFINLKNRFLWPPALGPKAAPLKRLKCPTAPAWAVAFSMADEDRHPKWV